MIDIDGKEEVNGNIAIDRLKSAFSVNESLFVNSVF